MSALLLFKVTFFLSDNSTVWRKVRPHVYEGVQASKAQEHNEVQERPTYVEHQTGVNIELGTFVSLCKPRQDWNLPELWVLVGPFENTASKVTLATRSQLVVPNNSSNARRASVSVWFGTSRKCFSPHTELRTAQCS